LAWPFPQFTWPAPKLARCKAHTQRLLKTAPKKRISLKVLVSKLSCEGRSSREIQIFSGEIQKAEADEVTRGSNATNMVGY